MSRLKEDQPHATYDDDESSYNSDSRRETDWNGKKAGGSSPQEDAFTNDNPIEILAEQTEKNIRWCRFFVLLLILIVSALAGSVTFLFLRDEEKDDSKETVCVVRAKCLFLFSSILICTCSSSVLPASSYGWSSCR